MLKITEQNYQQYKRVFEILFSGVFKDLSFQPDNSSHPLSVLSGWEVKSMARAKKGLKLGLQDILMGIADEVDGEKKSLLNARLRKEGLPGLGELIAQVKNIPEKVLKRGSIRNTAEWYAIKELLDNVDSDISEADRAKLELISATFEYVKGKESR